MARLCNVHGMVEGAACPQCGAPTLDVDIGTNKQNDRQFALTVFVMLVLLPAVGFVYVKNETVGTYVIYALVALGIGLTAYYVRRERAKHPIDPSLRVPVWTSTTMIATLICIAFVGLRKLVGIEALEYARGMAPWRIITASLTHSGFLHIFGNLMFFILFGRVVELRVGRLCMAAILAAAAIAGALVQAAYSAEPMVGFSAAVYGVFGATLALMPTSPQMIRVSYAVVPVPTWAWMFVVIPAFTLVSALDKSSNVAWIAHLGGFFAGLVVALPMRRVAPSKAFIANEAKRRERIAAANRQVGGDIGAGFGDVSDGQAVASSSLVSPEIAAYLDSERRRKNHVSVIGAIALILIGGAAAGIAAWLQAPTMVGGRRVSTVVAGLLMCVTGVMMLVQLFAEAKRRKV